jgi:hypothetical protein
LVCFSRSFRQAAQTVRMTNKHNALHAASPPKPYKHSRWWGRRCRCGGGGGRRGRARERGVGSQDSTASKRPNPAALRQLQPAAGLIMPQGSARRIKPFGAPQAAKTLSHPGVASDLSHARRALQFRGVQCAAVHATCTIAVGFAQCNAVVERFNPSSSSFPHR